MEQPKTNLFLVGAMRAGTSSLVSLLSLHPSIYISPIKEPNYFVDTLPPNYYEPSRFFNLDTYFEKEFPKHMHIADLVKEEHYLRLYSMATLDHKYKVDASSSYLHAPGVGQRIKTYNPEAKIIILLRDPLERAYSHYKMNCGLGRTTKSFENLIVDEILQYEQGLLPWHSYLGMSFYKNQIKSYTSRFGNNVLIIHLEELIMDTTKEIDRLTSFLGISNFTNPVFEKTNETRDLRFQSGFYFLKKIGLKDYFSEIFNANFKGWLFNNLSVSRSNSFVLSNETTTKIQTIFNKESSL